jgi:hypothetical protein
VHPADHRIAQINDFYTRHADRLVIAVRSNARSA